MSLFDHAQPTMPQPSARAAGTGSIKLTVCDLDALVCCPECGEPVEWLEPVYLGAVDG
jgi:hypothetical protein